MFHVKRIITNRMFKGITAMLFLFLISSSCIGARATIQIPDYILVPNGKENIGGDHLTAYVFENNVKKKQIEYFVAYKFKSANYFEREIWIMINKDKYKLIIYDNSDFEKYFNSQNYSSINEETKSDDYSNQRKFIAISIINAYNEDCLTDNSLFQNIAVKFLTDLKNEYVNQ
jgi:hypothetical protein